MFTDTAELMRSGESGNDRVITNNAMAGQATVVRKNDVITELTVVSNVRVAEK